MHISKDFKVKTLDELKELAGHVRQEDGTLKKTPNSEDVILKTGNHQNVALLTDCTEGKNGNWMYVFRLNPKRIRSQGKLDLLVADMKRTIDS